MVTREQNRCRRGHEMVEGNIKRRPSTKYVACRKCENHTEQVRRQRKSLKDAT